ncbi:MAG: tRNA pseudouridine(38-40) synthase TruA [Bacilli bacterium]|nr:tRNA pseudouridine(38-40) synthase TruA [Bacilli bacterium]
MNYVIKVAYDGSKFYGFQRLNEETSVQKVLEEALSKINKKEVLIKGAGRTDRGVHAHGQCVSFKLDINIDTYGLKEALNSLVKPYIFVSDVKEVDDNFHARFNVLKKEYVYKINFGEYDPCKNDYYYQPEYKLDIDKMKEVAKLFIGVHDFHNFVSGERDNTECVVYDINFDMKDNIMNITFSGKSFYRYMVRNMVGAMIDVARGNKSIEYIKNALESKDEISIYTAPASGLYLESVEY